MYDAFDMLNMSASLICTNCCNGASLEIYIVLRWVPFCDNNNWPLKISVRDERENDIDQAKKWI